MCIWWWICFDANRSHPSQTLYFRSSKLIDALALALPLLLYKHRSLKCRSCCLCLFICSFSYFWWRSKTDFNSDYKADLRFKINFHLEAVLCRSPYQELELWFFFVTHCFLTLLEPRTVWSFCSHICIYLYFSVLHFNFGSYWSWVLEFERRRGGDTTYRRRWTRIQSFKVFSQSLYRNICMHSSTGLIRFDTGRIAKKNLMEAFFSRLDQLFFWGGGGGNTLVQ